MQTNALRQPTSSGSLVMVMPAISGRNEVVAFALKRKTIRGLLDGDVSHELREALLKETISALKKITTNAFSPATPVFKDLQQLLLDFMHMILFVLINEETAYPLLQMRLPQNPLLWFELLEHHMMLGTLAAIAPLAKVTKTIICDCMFLFAVGNSYYYDAAAWAQDVAIFTPSGRAIAQGEPPRAPRMAVQKAEECIQEAQTVYDWAKKNQESMSEIAPPRRSSRRGSAYRQPKTHCARWLLALASEESQAYARKLVPKFLRVNSPRCCTSPCRIRTSCTSTNANKSIELSLRRPELLYQNTFLRSPYKGLKLPVLVYEPGAGEAWDST
ncbi:hypothetical protein PG994_002097 [Apiospora phragmitis]|uniref:Uncharacterized protein n=1 Tax=Apiospora phragmitis TaxID=2905665 RepID=A0ABR1WVD8_9PEZI